MLNGSKPRRRQDLVWREIDGETAIISYDNKKMQLLSDVGSRIWALLDGEHDLATIAAKISAEYGEKTEIVKKDLFEFAENLKRLNLLEVQ